MVVPCDPMPTNDDLKLKFDLFVRRLGNSGWDDLLERGMEAVKVVSEAVEKPGAGTVLRAAMGVARALTGSEMYCMSVLPASQWKPMFPNCVRQQLLEILEPHVTSTMRAGSETVAHLITRDGVRIGWVKDGDEAATEILAHVDCLEASAKFARDLLWAAVDPTRIVLSSFTPSVSEGNKHRPRSTGYGQLRVSTDDLVTAACSQFVDEYAPYLRKCLDHGITRTVLFYGVPGCGKSTISRTICDTLKLRSLRVRVEDISDLGSEPVAEMIKVFEPDVVIFDDLDRTLSQVALLEMLESLHKRVRFVFATVNHIESLQQALIRPGRFDELVEITRLDEAAVRKALAGYDDAFEALKGWPIAFINEYVIRRRMLGPEKAMAALEDLRKRVERLMGTSDGGEEAET